MSACQNVDAHGLPDHVRQYGYYKACPGCPEQEKGAPCRDEDAQRHLRTCSTDHDVVDALGLFDDHSPDSCADEQCQCPDDSKRC